MKNTHLAIGIAGSLALGAIIGIFCAPDKGCNTRKKIVQKGKDLKNNIKESIDEIVSSIQNTDDKLASKIATNAKRDQQSGDPYK